MLKGKTTTKTVTTGDSGKYSLFYLGKKGKKDGIEIQIVWETGVTSTESFEALNKDILVNLAIYAKENNLLELDGWNTLEKLADRSKLTEQLVKQAKLHSLKYSPRYKYGFEVPKNYKDAERLDRKNRNHDWMDADKVEHEQLREYNVFIDRGKFAGCRIPCGYQLIRVHTIIDVKVDGRHKARVVADRHLTAAPWSLIIICMYFMYFHPEKGEGGGGGHTLCVCLTCAACGDRLLKVDNRTIPNIHLRTIIIYSGRTYHWFISLIHSF